MLLNLCSQLKTSCHQSVISLMGRGPIAERLEEIGLKVTTLGMRRSCPNPLDLVRLMRIIRNDSPSIVQTWLYHADLAGGLAARAAGVKKIIWHVHNNDLAPERTKLRTRMIARLCAGVSGMIPSDIVFCSRTAAHSHIAMGYDAARCHVIPNGFDPDRFQPSPETRNLVRKNMGFAESTPLVGLIARFDPQKGHEIFFSAAAELLRTMPDARFILAGRGIDLSNRAIAKMLNRSGLGDEVNLLGERQDIPQLLSALDIAVCSSWGESFPLALGEAMACGIPCVTTDAGDAAEILGGNGTVVAKGDSHALAAAIYRLLCMDVNERRRLGERGRQRILDHYSISQIAGRFRDLYESKSHV